MVSAHLHTTTLLLCSFLNSQCLGKPSCSVSPKKANWPADASDTCGANAVVFYYDVM